MELADRPADRTALEAGALGVVLFTLYSLGACPTIYVGDSGELVTAVHVLGIPHPSGYPLYVLLGKLFTILVPIGSIAYRMSLFSAVCAATTCAVLYRLCRQLDLHPSSALFGSLLLAFAPSFWGEANVQRVYALGALFVVLALSTAFHWHRHRDFHSLVLTFFLCGLGAANHTFMGFVAISFGLFVVATDYRALLRPKPLAISLAATFIGLLPYAYLPIRSRMNPPLDWGNPETLDAFLGAVLRRDFWVRKWLEGPGDLITIALDYLRGIGIETLWIGAGLAVFGFVMGRKRRLPVVLAVMIMLANVAAMASHGSRSDIFIWHRYYIPSYIMVALLAAIGWDAPRARLPAAATWTALALPAVLLVTGWREFDRSRYTIAQSFSETILASLPPGSRLIATDDNILFVLIYLKFVEHLRPDVDLILQGVGDADLPPMRFNPDSDPVFFTHHPNWNIPALAIVPRGILFQAWRVDRPPPPPMQVPDELPGESDPRVPKDYLTQNLLGHFQYMKGFTYETLDWPRARRQFEKASKASPDNDVLFYNLGLIYTRNGLLEDAIRAFTRSDEINPRHLASQSRPRATDRIAELRAEIARLQTLESKLATDPYLRGAQNADDRELRLADLLAARDEKIAARGHRLLVEERRAGLR